MSKSNKVEHRQNMRKRYDSDLSDEEWDLIKHLVPAPKPGGRPAKYDRREILEAILYINRAGCVWRLLPHDFPPFRSVHNYFIEWRDNGDYGDYGVLHQICDTLRREVRMQMGRDPNPSGAVIDSQSVRTSEKGGLKTSTPKGGTLARR